MSQPGFAPLFIILLIVAALGISGVTYYTFNVDEKEGDAEADLSLNENNEIREQTERENITTSKNSNSQEHLQQISVPASSETRGAGGTSQSLTAQFSVIEQELMQGRASGMLLGEEHYGRIMRDLDELEQQGYSRESIDRLRAIARDLNPILKDKEAPKSPAGTDVQTAPTTSPGVCADTSPPVLVADITEFGKIRKITAPGSPSHEGPKGHSFIWTEKERVPVYAPLDAVFDSGSYSKDNAESPAQYLLFFTTKENCNFQFKFDHIDEPIAAISAELPRMSAVSDSRTSPAGHRIEFKAGDLVGYTKGTAQAGNWDFGLYNIKEKGVLAVEHNSYGMHGYAVCWVDYYAGEKQAAYRALLEGPRPVCSF